MYRESGCLLHRPTCSCSAMRLWSLDGLQSANRCNGALVTTYGLTSPESTSTDKSEGQCPAKCCTKDRGRKGVLVNTLVSGKSKTVI